MTLSYPSVKGLALSPDRLHKIELELHNNLNTYSIVRRVLRVVRSEDEVKGSLERFHKIGFDNLTDKIWFVDGLFGDRSFSVQGIGSSYAQEIARAETSELMKGLQTSSVDENPIRVGGELLSLEHIMTARDSLHHRGFNADVVLANVRDHVYLWRYPGYRMEDGKTYLRVNSGTQLLVEFAPEIPPGVSYVIDREHFGAFVIKEDLTLSLNEITPEERSKFLVKVPDLNPDKLAEMVRMLIYEVVRVDIDNPNAAIVLNRSS